VTGWVIEGASVELSSDAKCPEYNQDEEIETFADIPVFMMHEKVGYEWIEQTPD